MKPLYAMMVDLSDTCCLIVGGGMVAERKMKALLEANANIIVVSPSATAGIQKCALHNQITWHQRAYLPTDVEGCKLVIAATNEKGTNKQVYLDATNRDLWINVVDDLTLCNFTVPSVVQRGNLQISVSTNGTSPSLAKRIKAELEEMYGEDYAFYLSLMEGIRVIVKRDVTDEKQRSRIFAELSSSYWIESFRDNPLYALKRLQQWIEEEKGRDEIEKSHCG